MDEKKVIKALEHVMTKRYPGHYFGFGEYCEEALCIEKTSDGWIVYNGERGNKYNVAKCDTVLYACMTLIRRKVRDIKEIERIEQDFISLICDAA